MNNTEPRLLRVEIVADLPVLWTTLERLELLAPLDRHFPTPRHWKGPLTPGEVLAVWLLFILSQADHCLNHVEPWVARTTAPSPPCWAKKSCPPVPTTIGSLIGSLGSAPATPSAP